MKYGVPETVLWAFQKKKVGWFIYFKLIVCLALFNLDTPLHTFGYNFYDHLTLFWLH